MGKKLDALLGRKFKTSKFKKLVNLAISRIAYLEKEHRTRCSQARSDVIQLLNLGQQERALLRVEYVIREQNMLDSYSMIENYFNLLVERVVFIEKSRECPEELKEAVTSLIFAASRCGELPELQKIRASFTTRYGKELASRAVELRNNCGVDSKIVKKLSTRTPSLDSKLKLLREIAPTSEIVLQFEKEPPAVPPEEKAEASEQQSSRSLKEPSIRESLQPEKVPRADSEELEWDKKLLEGMKEQKYKDAEAAAEAAYNMATNAAAAARATIELLHSHGAYTKKEGGHEEKPNENSGGHGIEEQGIKYTRTTTASITSSQKLVKDKDVVEKKDESKMKQVQPPCMPERKISLATKGSLKGKRSGSVADENRDVLNYLISFENMMRPQATPQANPPGEKPVQEERGQHQSVGEQKHSRNVSMGRKPLSSRSRRASRG